MLYHNIVKKIDGAPRCIVKALYSAPRLRQVSWLSPCLSNPRAARQSAFSRIFSNFLHVKYFF